MDILEIELQTDNLTETEFFYSNILQLRLINKSLNSISFLTGQSSLTFVKSTRLSPKYHFAFNIPNNKIEEAILWTKPKFPLIENADGEVVSKFDEWNAKAIYFYDNNMNVLEFIARSDLDNSTDKYFDISSILSVSEIGIVTDQPLKLAKKLIENNSLHFFEKGSQSEKFATLGNDNGLFVIVETNRKWYPTQLQAEKHISKIKLVLDGFTKEIIIEEENASR